MVTKNDFPPVSDSQTQTLMFDNVTKRDSYLNFSSDIKRSLSNYLLHSAVWGCVLVQSSDFPFGTTMCPEEGGEKKKQQSVTLQSCKHAGSEHVPTEPKTSTQQLNKWPRSRAEACWGVRTSGQLMVERERDRLMKERERFKEGVRDTAEWGRGEGAQCEESLLFSLTFRGMCWLLESKSVRWRFPVSSCASQSHSILPVTTVTLPLSSNLSSKPGSCFVPYRVDPETDVCGGRWARLWRCVCDLSGCEVQVHIGSVEETAAVYIVGHCRCVASWPARTREGCWNYWVDN